MERKIKKAFVDFDKGIRPAGYKPPKSWYVLDPIGKLYPAKAIWAMAVTNESPGKFNTKKARKGLTELGFSVVDVSNVSDIQNFECEVEKARNDSKEKRLERLKNAPKKAEVSYVLVKGFIRNRDVVAETLERADGVCQSCGLPAPFKRKSNDQAYLEVHHKKPLAEGGEDTLENAIALCPNCHRKAHYG